MTNSLLFLLFVIFSLLLCCFGNIQVNPASQLFVDEFGRSLLFHGVNAVYKKQPYYPPNLQSFNSRDSLAPEDMQNLKKWGFNVVRLYMRYAAAKFNFCNTLLRPKESILLAGKALP